jgi:phage tail sheath protein FI
MPVAPSYPGVYIEEIPSGVRTITGVATSITAFVGYTARGPVNQPVRVRSLADYERAFGGLRRDSEVGYAMQQFFLNGGTDAYVVRVAKDAAQATATLRFSGTAGADALVVSAASAGAWGNLLRLTVSYATSNPDSTFNLGVTRFEQQAGVPVPVENELFRNLSMNSRSSTYVVSVVNAGSRLITVERPSGIAFTDRGFSLSGDLSGAFPSLTAQDNVIAGVLDGVDPFSLVLTGTPPSSLNTLVTRVDAAINDAGLSGRLEARRADALGANAAAGNFFKLTSLNVAANPDTAPEFSSVEIRPAPQNDLSGSIRLGLANGGRELSGARTRRPRPSGTTGADLGDKVGQNVSGAISVVIDDQTTSPATNLLPSTSVTLPATAVGPELATALQDLLRSIPGPATAQATVELAGTALRVAPSADTPNATVTLAGAGATDARLTGAGSLVNVQSYSLGTGADFGAQDAASPGSDGVAPGATEIIGSDAGKTGMFALRDVDLFNLMCIPGTTKLSDSEAKSVLSSAIALCNERRAFYLVDSDPTRTPTDIAAWAAEVGTDKNAAVFFPRIKAADPLDGFRVTDMPASGAIAGVFSRTDTERGVWKAPAGTDAVIRGARGVSTLLTDLENGPLNQAGVNVLRTLPVYGTVVWGGRTMNGADAQASEWKYIPVRRTALFIEESLFRGTKWVVFEPNDEPLWAQIRLNVGAFMHNLFRQGAFQGTSPREAYFVKCDSETTTQNDIDLGVVNILVGFAPLKPAEFVIIQIQQIAGQLAA